MNNDIPEARSLLTVRTKLRPIKKLYVIAPGSADQFAEAISLATGDMDGYRSLIFEKKDSYSKVICELVRRFGPDIVVNLTEERCESLEKTFSVPTYHARSAKSNLRSLTASPGFVDRVGLETPNLSPEKLPELLFLTRAKHVELGGGWVLPVQYGLLDDFDKDVHLPMIHRGRRVSAISDLPSALGHLGERDVSLHFLLDGFSFSSHTSGSVYLEDYNPQRFFEQGTWVIVGEPDNIEAATYAWNTRAMYPHAKILFVGCNHVEQLRERLGSVAGIGLLCSNEEHRKRAGELLGNPHEVDCSSYYFSGPCDDWTSYSHFENVPVVGGTFRIGHPEEKTFSDWGFSAGLVMEVRGCRDFILPPCARLGRLFVNLPNDTMFDNYFAKVGSDGLAIYAGVGSPGEPNPIIEEIRLPHDEEVFDEIFLARELRLKRTRGTAVTRQLMTLFGGPRALDILADVYAFELLVRMVPKRISRIVAAIQKKLPEGITQDQLNRAIEEAVGESVMSTTVTANLDEMAEIAGIPKDMRSSFFDAVGLLNRSGVLLRGRSIRCPHCESDLWYRLEDLSGALPCTGCQRMVYLPVHDAGVAATDSYRLNELVSNAVDQGVLPVLLVIRVMQMQRFVGNRWQVDVEVFEKGSDDRLAELDVLVTLGDRLGLVEAKADRGFDLEQADRMIQVSNRLKADFLCFATLRPKGSSEVSELSKWLDAKKLSVPAFILPKDALFANKLDLGKFFEVNWQTGKFPRGPIVVSPT